MKKSLLIIFCLCTISAFCWNAKRHMAVAAIAWDNLDSNSKEWVTATLINHPDFNDRWKIKYEDYQDDVPLGKFLLMQASKWPDDIRSSSHPLSQFSRPEWHYITYELRFSGSSMTDIPDDPEHKGDVVYAIGRARDMVSDPHTPDDQKAMFLAWLVHLIGDIHQPLHCASLFNDDFPEGDRGGNKIFIKPKSAGVKLHSYWDGAVGSTKNARTISNDAKTYANNNPKGSFSQLGEKLPRKWSLESFELAKTRVHLYGKLKFATEKDQAPFPGEDYIKNTKSLAQAQVALAGYRLANDIVSLIN